MIGILITLTIAVALVQFSAYLKPSQKIIDYFALVLLAVVTVYSIAYIGWFWLILVPALGLVAATINRHHGIASEVDLSFKNEIQWLSMILALSVALAWALDFFSVSFVAATITATAIVLVFVLSCHLLLLVHIRRYKLGSAKQLPLDELHNLPTVSVLIPARNESHALNDTITKLLQSTYPKLEVLILDDCSHDKTPEIIRGFAHDGARFLEGKTPPPEWLGRNWALQQLATAANGELLIFADTDVKFTADTVADLVGVMQRDELDIASVVPISTPSGWLGQLLPSLTNFWLSLVPFRLLHGRAAIGRCFALKKAALPESGFEPHKTSIYPVYGLSKEMMADGSRYKFFYGKQIGLAIQHHYHSTAKSLLRSLSPALSNRFDISIVIIIAALFVVVTPFAALAIGAIWPGLSLLVLITLAFVRVAIASGNTKSILIAAFFWPLHLVHEGVFLAASVIRYRFTDLSWKERRVCMPLLQAHQKLPEM